MAPDDLRLIFCWIIFTLKDFTIAATRIEVSVRGEPITVNGLLVVQCKVWDVPERAMITLELEKIDGRIVDIANGVYKSESGVNVNQNADRRYYLSTRTIGDATIYFLTVTQVTADDEGSYICTSFARETRKVEAHKAVVKLRYFPNNQYPVCSDTPRNPIRIPDNRYLTLRCTTNMGNPPVNISWHHGSNNANISERQWKEDDELISERRHTLTMEDQNAVFICRISSDMFWGRSEICQVGPLRLYSDEYPDPGDQPLSVDNGGGLQVSAPPSNTAKAGLNCKQETCERSFKVHVLIIAVGFTTILCLVFIITTIIMCYKYKAKREAVKQKDNNGTVVRRRSSQNMSTLNSGPSSSTYGYVRTPRPGSMTRPRPASVGTEPIYMTLEPPEPASNRNSIVIPKEIYDKYTLSIPRNVVISKLWLWRKYELWKSR